MWRTTNAPQNLDACQRFAGHETAAGRVRARRKPAPGESIHGLSASLMTGHGRRSKERNEWREELEADHCPKVVQRRLAERGRPSYLGDAILGGID